MLDVLPVCQQLDVGYNGKTLTERVTGKFYTPNALAEDLAVSMVAASTVASKVSTICATDPFCGDGRLMVALLRAALSDDRLSKAKWHIELRDRDGTAAREAQRRVAQTAVALGIRAEVIIDVGDSFEMDLAPRFDFVITNPPWELLKPDRREIAHLTPLQAAEYRDGLRSASKRLDTIFPNARGEGAWGGWGTNLARCGWDLCLKIGRRGGVVGIVLPSTLLADQSSSTMRQAAFAMNDVVDIAAYPPEARLFDKVDQPVVALTMTRGRINNSEPKLRLYGADRTLTATIDLNLSSAAMAQRGWSIPVGFGADAGDILERFDGFPRLTSLEGDSPTSLWLGRELDETRIHEKTTPGASLPFIKGRMVGRHSVVEQPTMSVKAGITARFHSTRHLRAVWRDVSRASQRRRMIGTIIPAGWVAGNSLHVACFRDGNPNLRVSEIPGHRFR